VAGARDDILRVLELAVLSPHEAVVAPLCGVVARLFTAFPISRPNPDMPAPAQAVLQKTHELLTHHLHHSANPAARARAPRSIFQRVGCVAAARVLLLPDCAAVKRLTGHCAQ